MKMKKKIIPIIISAIIFLVGCITAIIGAIIVNKGEAHLCPELDVFSITDNSIGKVFSCTMQEGEEKTESLLLSGFILPITRIMTFILHMPTTARNKQLLLF